ncbi:MAG: GNAT family N-acetyltransferase [Myxococcales bacterium]|nr:GNAT family N-acetyltransferase [Myxococcales bacterium]
MSRTTLQVPTGVRAPGWRSDLGLHAALGRLEAIDEGWRCELPSVPDNPFGNVLVLRGAPDTRSPEAVIALFEDLFRGTRVSHVCIGWDDPTADVLSLAPFVDQGFEAIDDVALALEGTDLAARTPDVGGLRLRRLDLDLETDGVLACELAVDEGRTSPYGRVAVRENLAWCRALLALGPPLGAWYGAELDGTLVATLGIVSVGGEGRLQSVGTRPALRNRGIGRALIAWAWRDAAARLDLDRLLLVTSRGGAGERFYRRMGFAAVGRNIGVLRSR